jgi:23S rRNA (guanosine2251-2'-O)-methyltransferase
MFLKTKNLVVGRNPVLEALKGDGNLDKILVARNATGEALALIRQLAAESKVPVQYVPHQKLDGLTNVNHQGVVAFKSAVTYYDLQQVIDWVNEKGDTPLLLMLDGVTDVRNVGAIARSALCCGAHGIIIPDKGVAALGEDALKSSAGALEHVHICRVNSLMKAVDLLHMNGIKVFASEMKAETPLHQLKLTEPVAIVMGSENKGVMHALGRICDGKFSIPMTGNFESLNVSVAAGMILYEAMRQRLLAQ